jgi:hypothetical protein
MRDAWDVAVQAVMFVVLCFAAVIMGPPHGH